MARRRKSSKTKTRTIYKKIKSKSRKYASKGLFKGLGIIKNVVKPTAMVYGALREDVANKLLEIAPSWFPGGQYKDELLMTLVDGIGSAYSSGMIKQVFDNGITYENVRVGDGLRKSISNNSNTVSTTFAYG